MTYKEFPLEPGVLDILLDSLHEGLFVIKNEQVLVINRFITQMVGYSHHEIIGESIYKFVAPEFLDEIKQRYQRRVAGFPESNEYETVIIHADGTRIPVQITARLHLGKSGVSVIGTIRDLSEKKTFTQALETYRESLTTIFDNSLDTVYQTNAEGILTLVSPSVYNLLGYTPEEMLGTPLKDYYWSPEYRQIVTDSIIKGNGRMTNVEAILRKKDGSKVWISTNAYARKDAEGNLVSIEGIARDITSCKKDQEELEWLATRDTLTSVYNRRHFIEVLSQECERANRYQGKLSLIYIDLDNFKLINDNFGHQSGDDMLKLVVNTAVKTMRQSDLIGRLGGDEFAIAMPQTTALQANDLGQRLIDEIDRCCQTQIEYRRHPVTLSIGIAEFTPGDNIDQLLEKADKAMYKAKRQGKNCIVSLPLP